MLEQRLLERGHRQPIGAVLTFAFPVPLLRDVPRQHAIRQIGVNPERLCQIGVEGCSISGDGRLEYGVGGVLPTFGAGRPGNHAVIEAHYLALFAPDLAGEDVAWDTAAVPAHNVRRNPRDLSNPGNERVAGRGLPFDSGKTDEIVREGEALG